MRDGTYAVIPVKPFASAKGRLAPILNSFERAQLARLMLDDVLDAVRAAHALAGFCVVTCDPDAAELAKAGGEVIWEDGAFGFTHAVETAVRELSGRAAAMVVIPADIPHLPSATIDTAVAMTKDQGVTLVPAICDGGTNLLAVRPCDLLPPLFGPESFSRYRMAALDAGITPKIHHCPKAGHDIDRPRDLLTFLAMRPATRTHDFVAGLNVAERLKPPTGLLNLAPLVAALA